MPSIQDSIQIHQQLIAEGKGTPVSPETLRPPDTPPGREGTGIPGPVRGSYTPDQVLSVDFVKANVIGGPMRSGTFPVPPNNTNNTAAARAALQAAAKASEAVGTINATIASLNNANVVTTAGPGGALQSGPISIGGGGPISTLPVAPRLAPRTINQDQMSLDGAVHGRVLQTALTADSVDPSKPGVLMKGSVPPAYSGAFTYTSTTTSITWSWTGLIIYNADGTVTNIPDSSQLITGLVSGTTYTFFPYYTVSTGTLNWVSSSSLSQPLVSVTGVTLAQGASPGYVTTTTNLTRPTSVSLEAWFHATTGNEFDLINFSTPQTGLPTTHDFLLSLGEAVAGEIIFLPGSGNVSSAAGYNDGNWHHVVATYNGTTAFLYVDGVQVATGAITAIGSFTGWWRLGTELNITTTGTLAHCSVYTGIILTATQATNHFNMMSVSGVAAYEALVAADGATYYWRLTETSGSVAADSIGSNTGTYQNTGSITYNQSEQIVTSQGSPAIAWTGTLIQAVQAQTLQGNIPLSGNSLTAATTSTGTGGGSGGGAAGSGGGGDKKFTG